MCLTYSDEIIDIFTSTKFAEHNFDKGVKGDASIRLVNAILEILKKAVRVETTDFSFSNHAGLDDKKFVENELVYIITQGISVPDKGLVFEINLEKIKPGLRLVVTYKMYSGKLISYVIVDLGDGWGVLDGVYISIDPNTVESELHIHNDSMIGGIATSNGVSVDELPVYLQLLNLKKIVAYVLLTYLIDIRLK